MKLLSSLSFAARVVLAGVLAGPAFVGPSAFAQAPGGSLAQMDFQKAEQLTESGNLQEAASLLEGIPAKYPTSEYIPAATVRLGYVYFRLLEYDKAVKTLQTATTLKNIPPEMAELAMSLVPQAQSAKAVSEGPKSPQRKRLFEEAIKGFDAFIAKYPASAEVEASNYGKAVALYQIEQFDDALKPLTTNLTVYKNSASVLDSQYLMALTLATIGNNQAQSEKQEEQAKAPGTYKRAEAMLGDIVTKGTDVALGNEARFQIGELLYSQATTTKTDTPAGKEAQKVFFQRALDTYRVVAGKDLVVAAQKARIEQYKQAKMAAFRQNDVNRVKQLGRGLEREQEKLATIESRPDQTLLAKIKIGQVFYQQDRLDECRVVLGYVKPLIEDEEQKKSVAYYYAVSLARQNADAHGLVAPLSDRAQAIYAEFTAAYPKDPIAENLPVIMSAAYADSNPEKALQYLDELKKNYPGSKMETTGLTIGISVLIKEKKYDEALKKIEETLTAKLSKEQEASVKFSQATVYMLQGDLQKALPVFKEVRDNYPGTEHALQSQSFYPQLLVQAGDFKTALPELQAFVKNNPKHALLPNALFFMAQAQVGLSQSDDALATYTRLAEEYPKAEVAPFSYFERAKILMARDKRDEVVTLMQSFMEKYPDDKALFQAYDFVAQIQLLQAPKKADGSADGDRKDEGKLAAIETYEQFATRKPADPMSAQALLQVSTFWKDLTNGMGRWSMVREADRPEWQKRIGSSMNAAERVVRLHPESPQVALALGVLLDDQKILVGAKLTTDADVETYFQKLADEFKDKPATRSKIVFTLAGNLIEKDKAKALGLMAEVYDAKLKYAPDDMDLYGTGLIDAQKFDEAHKLYEKLAEDYPNPAGREPTQAPRDIQEAQSMKLFAFGRILQEQGKTAEAKPFFDELEKLYGWSPKMLAAHIGIAEALYKEKNYEESKKRCLKVTGQAKAPPELRAHAMYLLSQNHEALEAWDDAINNYVKIARMYASVQKYAAGGLFRAAQILEKQSRGDVPIPTPIPRATPAKKPAPGAKPGSPAPEATPAATTAAN